MFEENIEWGKHGDEYDRDLEATRFWEPGAIDRGPVTSHVDDEDEDDAEFPAVKPHRPAANGNTVHRIVAVGNEAHRKAMIASGHQLVAAVGTAAGGSEQDTSIDAALSTLESLLDEPVRVTVVTGLANDSARVELVFGVAVDLEETDRPWGEAIRFADGDLLPVHRVTSLRVNIS